VPSLDNFHDEIVHQPHLVQSGEWVIPGERKSTKQANESHPAGLRDDGRHEAPYTWPVTFPGSPHDFRDSVSDQEDSDQDSCDQDMEYMLGDSESEDDTRDQGLLVAEMCSKWGWTLEDVLETLEQPGLEGRRKCLREKGVLRA
jgi:hypothetical protein